MGKGVRVHVRGCSWALCAPLCSLNQFVWQVPQPGTLRLSRLKEGAYVFQLTVTDSVGQRSSDNVSVTVLPRLYSTGGEDKVLSLGPLWPAKPSWPWKDGVSGIYILGSHFTGSSILFPVLEAFAKDVVANRGSVFRTICIPLVRV